MNLTVLADACAVADSSRGANPAAVANHNVAGNICEGLDGYILSDFSIGVYLCQVTNHTLDFILIF